MIHKCEVYTPKTDYSKATCWKVNQWEQQGELYLSINGEHRIEVKVCPFCGYSPDKNKELIEKFRPTLEKLSKE